MPLLLPGFSDVGVDGDDDDMVCCDTICYIRVCIGCYQWMDVLADTK